MSIRSIIVLVVLILLFYLFNKFVSWLFGKQNRSQQRYSSAPAPSTASVYANMPNDVYKQTEALARLINFVYTKYPFMKNEFAKGSLFIWKNDDGSDHLSFWFDWDYGGVRREIEKYYRLDSGFSFQDDGWIKYENPSTSGLHSWCYNSVLNRYYVDPVVATLQNNCPGLIITDQNATNNHVKLEFRYR